jgi:hypoxanthine phosphoribosyltransferase
MIVLAIIGLILLAMIVRELYNLRKVLSIHIRNYANVEEARARRELITPP